MKNRVDLQRTAPSKALCCRLLSLTSAVRHADGLDGDLRPRMRYCAAEEAVLPGPLSDPLNIPFDYIGARRERGAGGQVARCESKPGFRVATGLRARRAIGA
jgi:hypothetical protein